MLEYLLSTCALTDTIGSDMRPDVRFTGRCDVHRLSPFLVRCLLESLRIHRMTSIAGPVPSRPTSGTVGPSTTRPFHCPSTTRPFHCLHLAPHSSSRERRVRVTIPLATSQGVLHRHQGFVGPPALHFRLYAREQNHLRRYVLKQVLVYWIYQQPCTFTQQYLSICLDIHIAVRHSTRRCVQNCTLGVLYTPMWLCYRAILSVSHALLVVPPRRTYICSHISPM